MNKVLLFLGLALLVCPVGLRIADRYQQSDIVETYESEIQSVNDETIQESFQKAQEYNLRLSQEGWFSKDEYMELLNLGENATGIMGSIQIPKIGVKLPIRHGTDEEVLSTSVGHMIESSLPVGGRDTHCVLTGHRGLPSAELFTRLDEMQNGDTFVVSVCKKKMVYRVCEIQVVKPEEVESIAIQQGRDLVSLVTCTPYGLNTHRLIVTGERVADGTSVVIMEPEQTISKWNWIPCAIAVAGVLLLGVRVRYKKYNQRKEEADERKRKYRSATSKRSRRNAVLRKSRKYDARKVCSGTRVSKQ